MSLIEASAAAGLVAALLYVLAFNVCAYAAIASGGKFTSEEAYRAMENPFARVPRLLLLGVITLAVFVLARRGGIGDGSPAVIAVLLPIVAYVAVSITYALRAFGETPYGIAFWDAVKRGERRD